MNRFSSSGSRPWQFAIGLAMVVAACNSKGPTEPSAAPPELSPRPSLVGVRVAGPDRMAPGESAQFAAVLRYSDGSTREVTDDGGWYTLQPEIVSVSSTGLATANSRIRFPATDSSEVNAYIFTRAFQEGGTSRAGMKDTFVMPAGTYRLGGTVRDGGEPARAFLVQITSGLGAGTAIERCDIQGKCGGFEFDGVAGPTEIQGSSRRRRSWPWAAMSRAGVSSTGISGTMEGEFVMVAKVGNQYQKDTTCAALNHRIVLTR